MSTKVKVDGLADAIIKEMEKMKDVTVDALEEAVKETSTEALKDLKLANPAGSGKYGSWAAYNKGWKMQYSKKSNALQKSAVIYNATHYRLTHLLENGHAKQNGGRTRSFPHILPVAEKCEKLIEEKLKKGIESRL